MAAPADVPVALEAMSAEERRAIVDEHVAYARRMHDAGVDVYGDPLDAPDTAVTIRLGGGGASVTDGPVLETTEAPGGFYVLDCPSRDAAIALAGQVPRSPGLVAELRAIPDLWLGADPDLA